MPYGFDDFLAPFGIGSLPGGMPEYSFNPTAGVFQQNAWSPIQPPGGGVDDMTYQPMDRQPTAPRRLSSSGQPRQKKESSQFNYEQQGEQGPPSYFKDDYTPKYGTKQQPEMAPDPVSAEFDKLQMQIQRRLADATKDREAGRMANELAIFFGTIGGDEKVLQIAMGNKERQQAELDQLEGDLMNIGPAKAKALADYQERLMMEQRRQMEQAQQNQAFYAQIADDLDMSGIDPRRAADITSGAASGDQGAIAEALQFFNPQVKEDRAERRAEKSYGRQLALQEAASTRAEARAEQAAIRAERRDEARDTRSRAARESAIRLAAEVKPPPVNKLDADWTNKFIRSAKIDSMQPEEKLQLLDTQMQRMLNNPDSYHEAAIDAMFSQFQAAMAEVAGGR